MFVRKLTSKWLNKIGFKLVSWAEVIESIGDEPFLETSQNHLPAVLINSVEKSGTHLMSRLIELLGFQNLDLHLQDGLYQLQNGQGNLSGWSELDGFSSFVNPEVTVCDTRRTLKRILPGQYCQSHMTYQSALSKFLIDHGFKTIQMIRDPRDVAISWCEHQGSRPDLAPNLAYYYFLNSFDERADQLSAIITGMTQSNGIDSCFMPGINSLFSNKLGWLTDPSVLVVRFEDLIGPGVGERMTCNLRLSNLSLNTWG